MLQRVLLVALLVAASAACSKPTPPIDFREPDGFVPYWQHLAAANREVKVITEGPGTAYQRWRVYYIAYATKERVRPNPEATHVHGDPLWGEMQALFEQRRRDLDPSLFDYLIIDARRRLSPTRLHVRRVFFESLHDSWSLFRSHSGVLVE